MSTNKNVFDEYQNYFEGVDKEVFEKEKKKVKEDEIKTNIAKNQFIEYVRQNSEKIKTELDKPIVTKVSFFTKLKRIFINFLKRI